MTFFTGRHRSVLQHTMIEILDRLPNLSNEEILGELSALFLMTFQVMGGTREQAHTLVDDSFGRAEASREVDRSQS